MPRVHLYVPEHLHRRIDTELPATETLSGIFTAALEQRLNAAKPTKPQAA